MLNYIFDLDGTLVNSSEEILHCLKKAFLASGYVIDENKLTFDLIGPPIKEIIEHLAPQLKDNDDMLNYIIKNFRQLYDKNENDVSVLYCGIADFINNLKAARKNLFIATYKPRVPTMRIVNKFFPNTFADIYTIDKFGGIMTKEEMIKDIVSRYKLEKSQTVMIGDAASDVIAGKNAGVNTIGVLWGYGSDKSKLIENADTCISNVGELEWQKSNYQTI